MKKICKITTLSFKKLLLIFFFKSITLAASVEGTAWVVRRIPKFAERTETEKGCSEK